MTIKNNFYTQKDHTVTKKYFILKNFILLGVDRIVLYKKCRANSDLSIFMLIFLRTKTHHKKSFVQS